MDERTSSSTAHQRLCGPASCHLRILWVLGTTYQPVPALSARSHGSLSCPLNEYAWLHRVADHGRAVHAVDRAAQRADGEHRSRYPVLSFLQLLGGGLTVMWSPSARSSGWPRLSVPSAIRELSTAHRSRLAVHRSAVPCTTLQMVAAALAGWDKSKIRSSLGGCVPDDLVRTQLLPASLTGVLRPVVP